MLTPTIGPNWGNEEILQIPTQLRQAWRDYKTARYNTELTVAQKEEKLAVAQALYERVKKHKDAMNAVEKIRSEVTTDYAIRNPRLEQRLQRLDRAKAIAIDLPFRRFFDAVIDDQVELVLSFVCDTAKLKNRQEILTTLMVEVGGRFNAIGQEALSLENRFERLLKNNDFRKAITCLEAFDDLPEKKKKLQSNIDQLIARGADRGALSVYKTDRNDVEHPASLNHMAEATVTHGTSLLASPDAIPGDLLVDKIDTIFYLVTLLERFRLKPAIIAPQKQRLMGSMNRAVHTASDLLRSHSNDKTIRMAVQNSFSFFQLNGLEKKTGITGVAKKSLGESIGFICDAQIIKAEKNNRSSARWQELAEAKEEIIGQVHMAQLMHELSKTHGRKSRVLALT